MAIPAPVTAQPLWRRFPAAHQYLRFRLVQEIFPIEEALECAVEPGEEADRWLVTLSWPVIDFLACERFSSDALRFVFGDWSNWARHCAGEIADRLPV